MKKYIIAAVGIVGLFAIPALLLNRQVDGQGVLLIGLVDNEYQFADTGATLEKTQRVIPADDMLGGVSARLSKINAPAAFTSNGTYLRVTGVAQSGDATHIQLASAETFADDALNGYTLYILEGTGAHQSKTISDYVGATDTATVSTWTTNPDSTSVYEIKGGTPAAGQDAFVTNASYSGNGTTGARVEDIEVNVGATGTSWLSAGLSDQAGVALKSLDARVVSARVCRVKGTAVNLDYGANGEAVYFAHNRMLCHDSELLGNHIGVLTAVPDTWITNNMIVSYRDAGVHVALGDTAGQSEANHIYGSGPRGMGMYIDAAEFTSTGDKIDDSYVGVWLTGNAYNSQFTGLFSQKCWYRNVMCLANKVKFNGGRISTVTDTSAHSGTIGVEIAADNVTLNGILHDINWVVYGGTFTDACDAAVRVNAGVNFTRITNYTIGAHNTRNTEVGIHLDGANIGTVIDVTVEEFNDGSAGTADVAVKVDDSNATDGCDITVREKLREGAGSDQNLIDIGSGWTGRITLVQSDGTITVYDADHSNEGTAL